MTWGTPAGDTSFRDAIAAIEDNSAIEVVVAVRAYARRWMAAHVVVGLVAAYALLVYAVLYAWDAWAILVFPLAAGVISTLLVEYVPPLYRFLVPAWLREEHVASAARELFVTRRVHATRERTGLLVFIAVRARAVEVVGDIAVVDKLGETRLAHMAQALREAITGGPAAVGRTLANLAPEFAEHFPRRADDTNELADDVVAVRPD
jgi:putative membrane protein